MKKQTTTLAAISFMTLVTNLQAVVDISHVYDTVVINEFITEPGFTYREERYSLSPLPTTTVDFGALGDTVVNVTWAAPSGFNFEIFVPSGSGWDTATCYEINTLFSFGELGSGTPAIPSGISVTVDGNAASQALTASPNLALVESSDFIQNGITFDLEVGTFYSFSSITLSYTVPAAYDANFVAAPVENNIFGDFAYLDMYIETPDQLPTDTGRMFNLVAIPEPSSAMFLGAFSLVAILGIRRRGK